MEEEQSPQKFVLHLLHPTEPTLQSLLEKLGSKEGKDGSWIMEFLQAKGLEVGYIKWLTLGLIHTMCIKFASARRIR